MEGLTRCLSAPEAEGMDVCWGPFYRAVRPVAGAQFGSVRHISITYPPGLFVTYTTDRSARSGGYWFSRTYNFLEKGAANENAIAKISDHHGESSS